MEGDATRLFLWVRHRGAVWVSSGALLAISVISLWPVLTREGWPLNHEGVVWATRAGVLRAAWERGEWFPLWWPEGNLGFGSPMPALYHKLQNYVGTLLLVVSGEIKRAQVASLILFTTLGCLGMRAVALHLGATRLTATLIAAALPFTGYVSADWLVRGAFAEHAAFMLLPWLVVFLLELIRTGDPKPYRLAAILALLFYAHSMTALYAGFLVVMAVAIAMVKHRAHFTRIFGGSALAFVLLVVAVAPSLWLTHVLTPHVYFTHATTGYYVVQRHLTSLVNALFVGEAPIVGFSVAPDSALWAAVALSGALLSNARARRDEPRRAPYPELVLLLLATALMLFLRLEPARVVYEFVPGLRFIQFPWRLLSFTTVLLLALSAWLVARLQRVLAVGVTAALLIALVTTGRIFRFNEPIWLDPDKLSAAVAPSTYVRWIEYLPAVPHPASPRQLKTWARSPEGLAGGCEVQKLAEGAFVAQCRAPGVIALPYAYSGLELVTAAGHALPTRRSRRDPRVLVDVPPGATELAYEPPSWSAAVHAFLAME